MVICHLQGMTTVQLGMASDQLLGMGMPQLEMEMPELEMETSLLLAKDWQQEK